MHGTVSLKFNAIHCIPQTIYSLFTKVCKIYFKNSDVTSFHTLHLKYPTKHLKRKVHISEFIAIHINQYNPLLHMALHSANCYEVEYEVSLKCC